MNQEYPQRQTNAAGLFSIISSSFYQCAAQWFRPPFICYYDKRGKPVLLIHLEDGVNFRYEVRERSTRITVERLVKEKRIRRETHKIIDLEGAIPI